MTGREAYETSVEQLGEEDRIPWEKLTPWRQQSWEDTAAELVQKRLADDDLNRMTDDGGPSAE